MQLYHKYNLCKPLFSLISTIQIYKLEKIFYVIILSMKLYLHDLKENRANLILPKSDEGVKVFSAIPKVKTCIGCLGCWLKTPGMCVIDDRVTEFIKYLSISDELHIISSIAYGGLSSKIKAVLERSLGYILPFFEIKNDQMHHPPRYNQKLKMHYHVYSQEGYDVFAEEIETVKKIAEANAVNFSADTVTCEYYEDINDVQEAFI